MASNYRKKAVTDAYCAVNAISKTEAKNPEHVDVMDNALIRLWQYDKPFPGESEELMIERHEMETPAAGEATELADHFRNIDSSLTGASQWNVIFTMYNRMKSFEDGSTDTSANPELSDKSNINKEKETVTMDEATRILEEQKAAQDQADEAIKDIMAGGGVGTDIQEAEPKATTDETTQSAREAIMNSQAERMNVTMNASIDKVVVPNHPAKERAVDGENATGTIKDPAKELDKFVQKTGAKVQPDGTVIFENVPAGHEKEAKEIYDILVAAKGGSNEEIKAYVTAGSASIKYARLIKPGQTKGEYVTIKELIDYIVNEAAGVLKTAAGTQVQIKTAVNRNNVSSKGDGIATKKKKKANPWAGVATASWTKREDLIKALCEYFKELDTSKVEAQRGMSSEINVKYYNGKIDEETNAKKTSTYRIPLMVKQYVTEVKNEELKAKYDATAPAGRGATDIDLNDKKALEAQLSTIATIAAIAASNSVGGELFENIRSKAAQMADENNAKAAESFMGV